MLDNLDTCLPPFVHTVILQILAIWNNFKEFITEDLLINHDSDVAINIALNEINSILYENGTNCERIGLINRVKCKIRL